MPTTDHRPAHRGRPATGSTPLAVAAALAALAAPSTAAAGTATSAAPTSLTAQVMSEHLRQTAAWGDGMSTLAGEKIKVLVSYANTGTTVQRNVRLAARLPAGATVAGSAILVNALHPAGRAIPTRGLTTGRLRVGDYAPAANAYLTLTVTMPPANALPCGVTPLGLRITEQGGTAHGQAVLHLHVHRNCPTSMTPVPMPGA